MRLESLAELQAGLCVFCADGEHAEVETFEADEPADVRLDDPTRKQKEAAP